MYFILNDNSEKTQLNSQMSNPESIMFTESRSTLKPKTLNKMAQMSYFFFNRN